LFGKKLRIAQIFSSSSETSKQSQSHSKGKSRKKPKKLIAKTRIQLHVTCSSFRQIYPYETGLLMCDRIIAKNQTDFIKSRFTLESVVAAQELIHVAHSRDILRWF
jgi:hypothetical protein